MNKNIHQKFLDSLKGMTKRDAIDEVSKALNMTCDCFLYGTVISRVARDSIILWLLDGIVQQANAGDPSRLHKES